MSVNRLPNTIKLLSRVLRVNEELEVILLHGLAHRPSLQCCRQDVMGSGLPLHLLGIENKYAINPAVF